MGERVRPLKVRIAGVGHYVPDRVVTSEELEKKLRLKPGWIVKHTGIQERRFARKGQVTSDLALEASVRALDSAKLKVSDIDLLICATSGGDMLIPATSCIIQHRLGARKIATFDVDTTCVSFLTGLDIAAQYLTTERYDTILVVSSELTSTVLNWNELESCMLFGDGAGAAVIQKTPAQEPSALLASCFFTDGSRHEVVTVRGGGSKHHPNDPSTTPEMNLFSMNGFKTMKIALEGSKKLFDSLLQRSGLGVDQIKLFIPHQANTTAIRKFVKHGGVPFSKCYLNVQRYGNTAAASIPIALSEAIGEGALKRGDTTLLFGVGAGFTWGGSCLIY